MPRIAMCLRYEGTAYHGWQAQQGLKTVQSVVEAAISFVANHSVRVVCAGRTDAGVHAMAQVIHFDTVSERSNQAWVRGVNSRLPMDIRVLLACVVSEDFHARFSAQARRYRYVIYNDAIGPGILNNAVGWCYRPLDEAKMQESANVLLGTHDFSAFRSAGCQSKTPIRTMQCVTIQRRGLFLTVDVQANAFLLHMVRNIVGVLVRIGSGDQPVSWMRHVLASVNRREASIPFSPSGLYLVGVTYPPELSMLRAFGGQSGQCVSPGFLYE